MSGAAIGSEVAALTLGQWKADIASRMCRSGPSQMTMLFANAKLHWRFR
jgi:hypothetical protein